MYEHGAQFTIVGSDGTTLVFNDNLSGLELEDVTGFDSPTIRTNVYDLSEYDGAVAGDSFLGQRPVTLAGKIALPTATARNAKVVSLQRAMRGLRGDLTLKSTATGLPAMQATGRVVGYRLSGGFVKDFLISIICPDPRIYSQALQSATAAASVSPSNVGNFATPPTITLTGPFSNPTITNTTSGLSLVLSGITLVAGETLTINTAARTITKNDGSNWFRAAVFPSSTWWDLAPGASTVTLTATGTTGATSLMCSWRDAWV